MHTHIIFIAAAVHEVEEIFDIIKHRTHIFTRKQQQKHKARFIYTTPRPLYLVLRTGAEGIPKMCTSNPLHQTDVLPLAERDFLRFFLF